MIGPDLPEIPLSLKNIQHYLKMASVHDERNPVVSYWCRLYALQTGLKLSTKTLRETNFLMKLMDWLETTKKELHDDEAITNDIAAQAHLENWALKLFLHADKNDRAANFGKNVVLCFFTAELLYDVLTIFGELSEEAAQNRKYAMWKATYIYNCLKNNKTPIPGPIQKSSEDIDLNKNTEGSVVAESKDTLNLDELVVIPNTNLPDMVYSTSSKENIGDWSSDYKDCHTVTKIEAGTDLSVEQINKAQKFIKWAGSALNYDDVPTAVLNLQKALHLLTTGQELA